MDSIDKLNALVTELQRELAELSLERRRQPQPLTAMAGVARDSRRAQRLNQVELADLAGVSSGVVKRLESGCADVTMSNVVKILNVLGLRLWIG